MAERKKPTGGKRVGKSRVSKTEGRSGSRSSRHQDVENRIRDRKFSASNFSKIRNEKKGKEDGDDTNTNTDGRFDRGRKPFKSKKKFESQASIEKRVEKDGIRLNKFIANAGICSRRDADKHIVAGLVTINGKVVDSMGYRVQAGEEVKFDGTLIQAEKKVYALLNKPKNFITTKDDTHGRRTVMDLLGGIGKVRVYPVGRLDRATTGVLLFTNDGDLTKKLTHPKSVISKTYVVTLDKDISKNEMADLLEGVELEDGKINADEIYFFNDRDKNKIVVELHSGRNRIVRRMFEHLKFEVKTLDRIDFAGMTKKDLKRGQWRHLDLKEVGFLKMRAGQKK